MAYTRAGERNHAGDDHRLSHTRAYRSEVCSLRIRGRRRGISRRFRPSTGARVAAGKVRRRWGRGTQARGGRGGEKEERRERGERITHDEERQAATASEQRTPRRCRSASGRRCERERQAPHGHDPRFPQSPNQGPGRWQEINHVTRLNAMAICTTMAGGDASGTLAPA